MLGRSLSDLKFGFSFEEKSTDFSLENVTSTFGNTGKLILCLLFSTKNISFKVRNIRGLALKVKSSSEFGK